MRLAVLAVVAMVGACVPYPPYPPYPPGPPPPPPPPPSENQCRASDFQYLIGQNRSRIPPQPSGANWRVTCTTCPVTMDYNPYRLNILYDERSGVVREVRCG
jgi:hypothetical protein